MVLFPAFSFWFLFFSSFLAFVCSSVAYRSAVTSASNVSWLGQKSDRIQKKRDLRCLAASPLPCVGRCTYMYLHVPTSIRTATVSHFRASCTTDDHPPPPAIHHPSIRPPYDDDEWNRRFRGTAANRKPAGANKSQQELAEPTRCC